MISKEILQIPSNDERVKSTVAKHQAFWARGKDSLLRSTGVYIHPAPVQLRHANGTSITDTDCLEPGMIDPAAMVKEAVEWPADRLDSSLAVQGQFLISVGLGDLLPFSCPLPRLPWLEGMLGCPIKMVNGQIWSERFPDDPEKVIRRGVNFEHNPWLELYKEFLYQLQSRLSDRFPTSANTLFRGTCDLVASILGVEEACIAWVDDPILISKLMRVCADVNLSVIEAGSKAVQPFQDGFLSFYALWAPGSILRTQADHATLLSPKTYEKQILPYDLEVISSSPYSIFHLHNSNLHIAPSLVQISELSAIEVHVDPYPTGERKLYEVRMLQMIQKYKPLVLIVDFPDIGEADWLLSQLTPQGLSFNARFDGSVFVSLLSDAPGRQPWLLA